MNNSSAQQTCSITSSDTYTIDISSLTMSSADTITLSGSYTTGTGYSSLNIGGAGAAGSVYTINTGAGSGGFIAQDLTSIDSNIFTWKSPEEFVDTFPDYERVQKMCATYPGLKIAYEKFVTTYKLVRDDYDTPEDQRPKP